MDLCWSLRASLRRSSASRSAAVMGSSGDFAAARLCLLAYKQPEHSQACTLNPTPRIFRINLQRSCALCVQEQAAPTASQAARCADMQSAAYHDRCHLWDALQGSMTYQPIRSSRMSSVTQRLHAALQPLQAPAHHQAPHSRRPPRCQKTYACAWLSSSSCPSLPVPHPQIAQPPPAPASQARPAAKSRC